MVLSCVSHFIFPGNGHFTNVQRAVLMEDDQVVIKTLRLSEIPDRHKHLCSKVMAVTHSGGIQHSKCSPSPVTSHVQVCNDVTA